MKEEILALIRADVQQTRFINQLNKAGLSADGHLIDLSSVIFRLMRIRMVSVTEQDAIQAEYLGRLQCCNFTDDQLKDRVHSVYQFLSELPRHQ